MVVGPAAERHTVVPGAEHRRTAVPAGRRTAVGPEAHRSPEEANRRIAEAARFRSPEEDRRTGPGAAVPRTAAARPAARLAVLAAEGKAGRGAPGRLAVDTAGTAAPDHLAAGRAGKAVVRRRRSPVAGPVEDLGARTSSPAGAAAAVSGREARSPVEAAGSRPEARSRTQAVAADIHSHNQARAVRGAETSGRAARPAAAAAATRRRLCSVPDRLLAYKTQTPRPPWPARARRRSRSRTLVARPCPGAASRRPPLKRRNEKTLLPNPAPCGAAASQKHTILSGP
mmetsp:Transcript_22241/g.62592  ORF Transcript_22241/g.62592 Transcript_22241/m.62592 type:complete len:285 (-) Transcript_22241:838-1692(-)